MTDSLPLADARAVERAVHDYEVACRDAARHGVFAPELEPFLAGLSDRAAAAARKHFPRDVPLLPGYRLLDEVGRGGMGVVYRGLEEGTGREVAVKVLDGGELARAGRLRLLVEGDVLAHLEHPHIVPVEKFGEHDGRTFMVMPLVRGGNLCGRIAEWSAAPAHCPPGQVADRKRKIAGLIEKLARAADHVHRRGVIHRDLKPANVLLDDAGEPLLCDFGLARRIDETVLVTHAGQFAGTIPYTAPEQLDGRPDLTTAVDVYSLGAILYELLTGHPPFAGPGVGTTALVARKKTENQPPHPATPGLNPNLCPDGDLEWIAMECLYLDPEDGFKDAAALADALGRYANGERVRPRKSWWDRIRGPVLGGIREPEYVHRWFRPLRVEAVTCTLAHVGMFLLLSYNSPGWALWLWLLTADTGLGWFIWVRAQRRKGFRLTPMELDVIHLWAAATAGEALLFALYCPLFSHPDPEAVVRFYATWAVMRGVLFFVEGHLFWPRLRIVGVAYAVTAVVLPSVGLYAPLVYGFLTGGWFFWLSFQANGSSPIDRERTPGK